MLCILTFAGRGYSPAFTENLAMIAGRLSAGEEIEIVEGPDDICAPLLTDDNPHCHLGRVSERDRAAANDVGRFLKRPIRPGDRFLLSDMRIPHLRAVFASGDIRSGCQGCEWEDFCTNIAHENYREAAISWDRK
nr:DUF1284 domain-containing protein [Notoacmeibacter sp. MSK16QG-6]